MGAQQPFFSVVIPVFNNWEMTRNCLKSLKEHTGDAFTGQLGGGENALGKTEGECSGYEVIVVDNGSTDSTVRGAKALGESLFGERFSYIRFEENRNFGPGCNAGAAAAAAPYLFFLNNDTLLTPGWAPPLLAAFADDVSLGAVGPLLLYEDDTVQHFGVSFTFFSLGHLYSGFPSAHKAFAKKRYFQAITAAALFLPKALFFEHGGFFEEYRNGFEDVDLCLHLYNAGKRLACIPESRVYHLESRTPGRKQHDASNGDILRRRCGRFLLPDRHILGAQDGFVPFVDDAFDISLRMSAEDERFLLSQVDGKPGAVWLQLLAENPYWVEGRKRLADLLVESGQYAEALDFRGDVASITESAEEYLPLVRLAMRAADTEAARRYSDKLDFFAKRKTNAEFLAGLKEKLDACGDPALQKLYAAKLLSL